MHERNEIQDTLIRVRLQSSLWSLPLISNTDVPLALGISQTTWQALKLEGDAPPCVSFGRRMFYRPSDLRLWLDAQEAKKNPGDEAGVEVRQVA